MILIDGGAKAGCTNKAMAIGRRHLISRFFVLEEK